MNANRHGLAGRRRDGARIRRRAGFGALLLASVPAVGAMSAPSAHPAQMTDRGTFRITVGGVVAGEEDFLIQRSPSGAQARGTVTMRDGRKVITFMELAGPELRLSSYQASATDQDTASVFVAARGDGALDARMTGPWGEEVREYRARPSTVVLDDGVAHHYFVLATAIASGGSEALHLVAPLARSEEDGVDVDIASETIRIDGENIVATRVRLGAGDAVRSAWFDGGGRLVRVAVPALDFLAQRTGGG